MLGLKPAAKDQIEEAWMNSKIIKKTLAPNYAEWSATPEKELFLKKIKKQLKNENFCLSEIYKAFIVKKKFFLTKIVDL